MQENILSNKFTNDLPSMTPDKDQLDSYKNIRAKASRRTPPPTPENPALNKPAKSSGMSIFITMLAFSLIGAGGWWLYQQDMVNQSLIAASERRIQELEKQLSVTGEEMGESTVAMKIRLEKLTIKTEELWVQMDKLWSSAWRKNQADIEKLNIQSKVQAGLITKQSKQSKTTADTLAKISQKQTEMDFSVGILSEQIQSAGTLKGQLDELQNSLATLQSKMLSGDQQQIELASSITQLKKTQQLLLKHIKRLQESSTASNAGP